MVEWCKDKASNLGSSGIVDASVRRMTYGYDGLGRIETITSWDAVTGGDELNQVKLTYDGWGNVIKSQQDHSDTVSGSSPDVEYFFDEGPTSNPNRATVEIQYRDGREMSYGYASNVPLHRVSTISESLSIMGQGGVYAEYAYVDTSRVVAKTHSIVIQTERGRIGTILDSPKTRTKSMPTTFWIGSPPSIALRFKAARSRRLRHQRPWISKAPHC